MPEPEPLPTVVDMSSAPKEISFQVGKLATISASPQQRKIAAEDGPPTKRRKWGRSLAAAIIVLSLVSGGALMLMGPLYRSAVAEMKRLTARENAETEPARKAAEEKALAKEAERKAAEENLAAVAALGREESRQAYEEKAKAEAARQMAEADAQAAQEVPTAPMSAVPTLGQSELSPSEIVEVQTRLEALGMKPGPLDGNLGPRTIRAIKRYEEANGRPQTGNIDREILGRLRQEKPISQAESASRKAAAPSAAAGADQLYNDAFKKLQEGDYAGAERGFKAFLQSNPKHVLAGNAQYWLGDTYYARRDYQNAMTAFAEGDKVYKASPKGPDNLLKLGLTLAVLGRKPDACAVFAKFNQDYPRATDLQKRRVEQERQKNGCG